MAGDRGAGDRCRRCSARDVGGDHQLAGARGQADTAQPLAHAARSYTDGVRGREHDRCGMGLLRLPSILEPMPPPSPVTPTRSQTPAPTVSPKASVNPFTGLVAYNVREVIDPAPEGCTPPNHPWCAEDRIWVVNADGSDPRALLPDVQGDQHFLAWHPDGRRLLYNGDRGALVLSDLAGSNVETFPASRTCPVENCPSIEGIDLSPDGTRIAYVLGDSGTEDTTVLAIFELASQRLTLLEPPG